jgi:hypothetical protein
MPWKVMTIVWPAIVAALLPLELRDVIARLPSLIERLAALDADGNCRAQNDRSRPHQVADFRSCFAARLARGS